MKIKTGLSGFLIGLVVISAFIMGGGLQPKEGYICIDYKTVLRLTPQLMEGGISLNGSKEHPTIYNITVEVISDYPLMFGLWDIRDLKALYFEVDGFKYNFQTPITQPTHLKYIIAIKMPQSAWNTIRFGVTVIFESQIWEWKQFYNQVG